MSEKERTDVFSLPEGHARFILPERICQQSATDLIEWLALLTRKLERIAANGPAEVAEPAMERFVKAVEPFVEAARKARGRVGGGVTEEQALAAIAAFDEVRGAK